MGTFSLEPVSAQGLTPRPSAWEGLGSQALLQNARWFVQIRWFVVAAFVGFGAVTQAAPATLRALGIAAPTTWPWLMAGAIAAVNLVVIACLRPMTPETARPRVAAILWLQIVLDLLVLTVLVYLVGALDTIVAFAYLLHITLACIFFAQRNSVVVLLLSSLLYLSLVALQITGHLPAPSILAHAGARPPDALAFLTAALPTVCVWFVVWYLVSTISGALRQRDRELDEANRRLLAADAEKNRQMLRVTHDLKAPFVGIESNIQLLRSTCWEEIPEAVRQIVGKIESRGATLRARIGDILTLGNLRSNAGAETEFDHVDLRPLLDGVIHEVQDLATRRKVTISLGKTEATAWCDAAQLRILFLNLIANAVSYSTESNRVEVQIDATSPVRVRVIDHGIGISEAALPHIFEDFYRASEAARFNPQATGLGLAIVRQIGQNLRLTLNVSSVEGEGTTFEVAFPAERKIARGTNQDH